MSVYRDDDSSFVQTRMYSTGSREIFQLTDRSEPQTVLPDGKGFTVGAASFSTVLMTVVISKPSNEA